VELGGYNVKCQWDFSGILYSYIFGRATLLLFWRVVEEVLRNGDDVMKSDIVSITIEVE
jgi:hypothetical protein